MRIFIAFISSLLILNICYSGLILAEPTKMIDINENDTDKHNWKQVHVHSEEQLVDKYRKKVKTIAYHHFHEVLVYRTIHVFTYHCDIHDEYRTVVDFSPKREVEKH